MTTSTTTPPAETLAFPQIEACEVEAVRRFLTGGDGATGTRPARSTTPSFRDRKCPTVRTGITRARFRSADRSAG